MNAEQTEIIGTFAHLLRGPTEDGGRKRERRDNPKPLWKVDPDHEAAFYRHLKRAEAGEMVDEDSNASVWTHIGWRALALAAQQEHAGEPGWIDVEGVTRAEPVAVSPTSSQPFFAPSTAAPSTLPDAESGLS